MDSDSTPPSPPPLPFRPILSAKQHYKKSSEFSLKSLLFSIFFIFLIVLGLVFLISHNPEIFGNFGNFGKIEKGIEKPDPYVVAYEEAQKRMESGEKGTEETEISIKTTQKPPKPTETRPKPSSRPKPKPSPNPLKKTCLTPECMNIVSNIRSFMNENVAPCDDFYQHVCGNFKPNDKEKELKEEEEYKEKAKMAFHAVKGFLTSNSSNPALPSVEIVQNLYSKCVNGRIQDFTEMFGDVRRTGWPRFKNFEKAGINEYFKFFTLLDPTSSHLFSVESYRKNLQIAPNFCKFHYEPINQKFIRKLFEVLTKGQPPQVLDLLLSSLEEALQVDRVGIHCSEQLRKSGHPEEAILVSGQNFAFNDSLIDFEQILRTLMGRNDPGLWDAIQKHVILVDPEEFLKPNSTLNTLIRHNPRGLAQFLAIKYIEKFAHEYFVEDKEIPDLCARTIVLSLPRTSLSIYVNHFVSQENVQAIPRLVETMKSEFRDLLNSAKWMDKETAMLLTSRINEFTTEVGASGGELGIEDRLLEKTSSHPEDSFYQMRRSLNIYMARQAMDYLISELDLPLEQEKVDVKANFNNRISPRKILAPLLSDPIFDTDYPIAVQFGRAGFLIGHEMGHVINPRNRKNQLDEKWAGQSVEEFNKRGTCVLQQAFVDRQNIKFSSFRQTMADYFGVLSAWNAFEAADKSQDTKLAGFSNLSDEKLFFYSNVQMKCQKKDRYSYKDRARINGIFSQIPGFHEAFKCPKGSPMRPNREMCRFF